MAEPVSKDPLLVLQSVSLSFGGLKAVSQVRMELLSGEIEALIGPNGAGKTTVFNLITGVYPPDEGEIRLAAHTLIKLKPNQIAALGVARTFQNVRLFKDLTVLDNVKIAFHLHHHYGMGAALLRLPRFWKEEDEIQKKVMDLLSLFSLQDRAYELASNLPYGEQRELEIVRALATRPSLLLLDEPAAGMNTQETKNLMGMIRRIRDEYSLAILLIEHDMKLVMGISDWVTVLDHGVVIARGRPDEIRENPKVIEAYLGTGTSS